VLFFVYDTDRFAPPRVGLYPFFVLITYDYVAPAWRGFIQPIRRLAVAALRIAHGLPVDNRQQAKLWL
jgi:hypothetical protein